MGRPPRTRWEASPSVQWRAALIAVLIGALLAVPLAVVHVATPARSGLRAETDYFVADGTLSTCSNAWSGTSPARPWCDLRPVDGRRLLQGDRLLLECGGEWRQPGFTPNRPFVTLEGTGTAAAPIVVTGYRAGSGRAADCRDRPHLRGLGADAQVLVVRNPDHWRIEGLELSDGAVGLRVHFTTAGHRSVVLRDLEVHDFKGIYRGDCGRYPNVYTALGVLFDHSADLLPPAPRSILSGIEITALEGYHNQGSLGLSGYGCAAVSTTSSNLYRDVLLQGLHLHDDGGPAPACSDGLQLVSLTNVRIIDSRFEHEGSCRTTSGTTGVILGQVDGVEFVNDVFARTPDTGSPDQSGIDLENFTRRVSVRGSYLGENAGAGLEVLTINGDDNYHDAVQVDGDLFAANSTAPLPGTGETGHIWRGGTGIEPTGMISGNLYSSGTPLVSGALPGVEQRDNRAVVQATHAARDFGSAPWSAQASTEEGRWSPLTNGKAGGAEVSRFHLTTPGCTGCAVARVWTAPRAGSVSLRGYALVPSSDQRASVSITLNGRTVLPATAVGGDAVPTDPDDVAVRPGDEVRFEVRMQRSGSVSWAPAVGYTG